jgi:hypothetical protein
MKYKLYYIDSKGDKRYLHSTETGEVWETDSMGIALKMRWAEWQQGRLLTIESTDTRPKEETNEQVPR